MTRTEIGRIITNGGNVNEIRSEFPWFPLKPTIDFFVAIGYKEATAKKYLALLEQQEKKQRVALANDFIMSDSADINYLLVDASSLAYSKCLKLIDDAEEATFIYATIQEMDQPFSDKDQFKKSINNAVGKILSSQKILLSEYGHDKAGYTDDLIIEYLGILPQKKRPTLLTADRNLSAKAKVFGYDYILYVSKNETVKSPSNYTEKKLRYGIRLIKDITTKKIYILYDGPLNLEIIHNNMQIAYQKGKQQLIHIGDAIGVYEVVEKKQVKKDIITNIF